jgi:poly-gamma-glutamate synthesis protein (capsule biosynthesis protein)
VAGVWILTLFVAGARSGEAVSHAPAQPGQGGPDGGEAKLVFVGDLMMGRYVNLSMLRGGFDAPFKDVTSYMSSADLAIGNLEGPIVPPGIIPIPPASPNQLNLTGNRRAAPALARAGLDLLSLANNHAYDDGLAGIAYTTSALRQAGIAPLGLDSGRGQAPVIKMVQGLRLAFLAYTDVINIPGTRGIGYVNPYSPTGLAKMAAEVAAARSRADVVIVMMHWGTEYALQPDEGQRIIARKLVAAGADLVVGAHPHVGQGMDLLTRDGRTVPVAYSLGNALFDQQARQETRDGLSLECVVDKDGVKMARLVPLRITTASTGYVMQVNDNAAGQFVLQRAAQSTTDPSLNWEAMWDASQPSPGLALAYRRPLTAGRASLEKLGTGAPTRVDLAAGKLTVSTYVTPTISTAPADSRWQTIWTSEPDWRVTGYSVGDANGDGKPDLIYTLWKRQQTWDRPPGGGLQVNPDGGNLLPHIFINSWERGGLNPLWQGSPRPRPILSAVSAPIGPQGKPILATLESSDPIVERAPGRITLWAWTGGFGYELAATLPTIYSDLWADGQELIYR